MTRSGQANRAPLLLLGGLLLIVGGAVAIYRYWPSADGPANPANPGQTNPGPANPGPGQVNGGGKPVDGKPIEPLPPGATIQVPFILWGGDVATFLANGGLETGKDSIFAGHGLSIKLTPGDDFDKQVDDYLANKSPFLRGTLSMLGQASDKLTAKPETTPVVFLQLTWSAGDHLVGRTNFGSLNDLKGKKIALQKGGPHVGMLNDCLRTTGLTWKDITVVWTDDVSGDKGPAALFRKDGSIDGCFAISPEMTDLSGGLYSIGDGEKKSVRGAHVVVSTKDMSHSIADVYACRKDFFDANRPIVERFAAGYIKGCEELGVLRDNHDAKEPDKDKEKRYTPLLQLAQDTWGKDQLPALDDVHGLISDATFAGLPGNMTFFTAKGNLTGFGFKLAQAQALPEDPAVQPFRVNATPFRQADFDYDRLRTVGGLNGKPIPVRFPPEIRLDDLKEKPIYSFNIYFDPGISSFSEAQYGKDFQRALEEASLFGNAVVAIRGHATPDLLVKRTLDSGVAAGYLKVNAGNYTLANGQPFDLGKISTVLDFIAAHPMLKYDDDEGRGLLRESVTALQKLSDDRAAQVRNAIVGYANGKSLVLEANQMRSQGVGVKEPIYPNPATDFETSQNRRVEFSIIKLPPGTVQSGEFGL